jgi:hypothetical protein
MRRRSIAGALFCAMLASVALSAPTAGAAPVTTHPRLWVTQADLPTLRAWAVPTNPLYQQGLVPLAANYKARMDSGQLYADDSGCNWCYVQYPLEWAAELFAFMSLIESDALVRADYASRARTLLMYVMDKAVLGPTAQDADFRWTSFSTNMRSLFYGEAFPLTVDWIYPVLSAADKATIRTVFLRWQQENLLATTSGLDHPEPVWVLNSPALLANPYRFRTAANNFYLAHMNQIGLMALALDAADDPGDPAVPDDQVRDFLPNAIGAWLYVHHQLGLTHAAGGVPPEGAFYGPTGLGRAGELLLALHTAGQADPAVWGPQVAFDDPYWQSVVAAHLHLVPPVPSVLPGLEYLGPVHVPADHGDTQDVWLPDPMTLMGTIGLHARATGQVARYDATRWIETHVAPGGAAKLLSRAGDWNHVRDCLLYFLLFDPAAPPPADPRPGLPLAHVAPGIGRVLARTGWDAGATFFTYHLGWSAIDHQHQSGNMFELYRKGEWLTKQWSGYGNASGGSDFKNTLALQNDPPSQNLDFWQVNHAHGSQYRYVGPSGDPNLLALSLAPGYVYALGDATRLYNLVQAGSTDIAEATRSIVWLKPDTIVVYDRAASQTPGRFKRFWLNLPTPPAVAGPRATALTPGGQQLVVDTLLPAGAILAVHGERPDDQGYDETAVGESMQYRLRVEAPGGPAVTRFLHVLQGLDGGAPAAAVALVQSQAGDPFAGAAVGAVAVLFPVQVGHVPTGTPFGGVPFTGTTYAVPGHVTTQLVTGLAPGAGYQVSQQDAGADRLVTVAPGGPYHADAGGVLVVGASGPPGLVRWLTAPDAGTGPRVRAFDSVSGVEAYSVYAYAPAFTGGVRVALGDVTGDSVADLVTAAGPGGGPHVRVLDGVSLAEAAGFFAYDPGVRSGLFVAAGDVDGDGRADIVTGPGPGAAPHVRVFTRQPDGAVAELRGFFAYDPGFLGGIAVAACDVDGDGRADVVTGAGPGGGPHVQVFSGATGAHLMSFFAYDPGFRNGIFVACGDLDGDGRGDLVTGAGPGGGPHVQAWSGATGALLASFFAYDPGARAGVRVAVADADGDGQPEILTAPGPGAAPHVRVFRLLPGGAAGDVAGLFAYDPSFTGGVFVAGTP